MKEVFVFDLDGTLLDPRSNQVPISTINALRRLKEKGHFCMIATGRSFKSVLESGIVDIIPWDGFVVSNGQQVNQNLDKIVYKEYFDHDAIVAITDYADQHNLVLQYQASPSFLNKEPDEALHASHNFFHEPIPELVKTYTDEKVEMLMVYTFDHKHFDHINTIPGVIAYPGQAPYADINDSNYSKHEGIMVLLESYNLDPSNYIAFGDGSNDIEMIRKAKLSFAMGNASPLLKLHADVITKSVHNDGIYTACMLHGWI